MKRIVLVLAASIAGVWLIWTIAPIVAKLIMYKEYDPAHVAESRNFHVHSIRYEYKEDASSDSYDYLTVYIDVENTTEKRMDDFQIAIHLDPEMQKYAPILRFESIKIPLKGENPDDRGNHAKLTNDVLIVKPGLLSEAERECRSGSIVI